MLRLLFGFCGWFGVLLSPASTAPNYQTSPNQLTKSSESGDHGLISPPGKELGSIQHPIYRYLPSSALGPFFGSSIFDIDIDVVFCILLTYDLQKKKLPLETNWTMGIMFQNMENQWASLN